MTKLVKINHYTDENTYGIVLSTKKAHLQDGGADLLGRILTTTGKIIICFMGNENWCFLYTDNGEKHEW